MDSSLSPWVWIVSLAIAAAMAFICARIAGGKGHSPVGYGILGFFLPLIGLIAVLLIKDRNPVTS
jgi:hypothetical protein